MVNIVQGVLLAGEKGIAMEVAYGWHEIPTQMENDLRGGLLWRCEYRYFGHEHMIVPILRRSTFEQVGQILPLQFLSL